MYFETVRNGRSRSSKVVDFCTNRKRVCDFLLVINNNLNGRRPILPRFRDIASFLLKTALHAPSTRILAIFGVFPRTRLSILGLRGAKTLS